MVLYARDIVETDFPSMTADATALEAARAMKERRRGFVIVASAAGAPEGIVTEWDLVAHVLAESRDPSGVRIGDVMSRRLVTVDARDGIDRVAAVMAERGTRRVLVVRDGKVLGIIEAKTILARMKEYIDRISTQIARAQGPTF